jgi:uncharacterized membrane protein
MTVEAPSAAPAIAEPAIAEPMPFRRLIDEAGKLLRQHFRSLFLPLAIPFAALQVAATTVQLSTFRNLGDIMTGLGQGDWTAMISFLEVTFLFTLAAMVVYMLAVGAIISGTANATSGRPVRFATHWGHALKPRIAFTLLLLGLLLGVGFACCVLPGLLLASLFGFAIIATVEDGVSGVTAFQRSYELTGYNPRGEWTSSPRVKIAILLVLGWILSFLVSLVLQLPLQIVQQVLLTRDAVQGTPEAMFASKWMWLAIPNAVLGALGSTAVLLYVGFGLALLYWDVRSRAEGRDLEAALDALDVPRFEATSFPPLPDGRDGAD